MTDLRDPERAGPPLKVWWIPQIPMKPFEVLVNSFSEAQVLLTALAQYDLFQLENNIKPDFSNAGGLMIQDDGEEYTDWYHDDGRKIDDLTLAECRDLDWAWAQRVARENVAQVEGAAV